MPNSLLLSCLIHHLFHLRSPFLQSCSLSILSRICWLLILYQSLSFWLSLFITTFLFLQLLIISPSLKMSQSLSLALWDFLIFLFQLSYWVSTIYFCCYISWSFLSIIHKSNCISFSLCSRFLRLSLPLFEQSCLLSLGRLVQRSCFLVLLMPLFGQSCCLSFLCKPRSFLLFLYSKIFS